MIQVLNFLSERARGAVLTVAGAGTSILPTTLDVNTTLMGLSIEPLQRLVLILTSIVAILTIISYGYKFYKFCSNCKKH